MIIGTYLCIGKTIEPMICMLSADEMKLYYQRFKLASSDKSHLYANRLAFGHSGIDYAFPAWSSEAMLMVAESFEGPYRKQTRLYAACLAADQPIPTDDNGDGGTHDRIQPQPKQPVSPDAIPVPVNVFDSI